ncbi:preprotein translocase subunit SecE [Pleionea litopenaei]|uniref:Protein translocase subunit SecE n=1 Tax=Pleionea litopenaei TaxID=3070815 RepID=A0AA51RX31_9GAMM|nr:preprotein translocase subunit SecE [Pleionea sp. HL-JVS1]WMS89105.1 preprotein translocase subunit SecE [Pleionea sp. HL-JVS1]
MSTEANTSSGLDTVKWLAAVLLVAGAVYGNHYMEQLDSMSLVIRVAIIIGLIALALLIASTTGKGKTAINFARESRMEVRKVVWPTRQEAIQTTLVIVLFVIVVSLFLWGVDSLLGWGVSSVMSL